MQGNIPGTVTRLAAWPAALAAVVVLTAGCGGGSGSSSLSNNEVGGGSSGVRGVVISWPSQPVSMVGQPDPGRPLGGAVVSLRTCTTVAASSDTCTAVGAEVGRATSDAAGNYEIPAAPGIYVAVGLPLSQPGPFPTFQPDNTVLTVTSGQFTAHTVAYDSGIR